MIIRCSWNRSEVRGSDFRKIACARRFRKLWPPTTSFPSIFFSTPIRFSAVGHATIYAYDGFDRLAQTTFADSTVSQPDKELISAYDSDGNILTKVNRASETLTYTYDALDRMLTKAVPAVGSIPANTVTWGYDLINEKTGISDTLGNTLTNVYDLAKRETSASRVVPGLTGTQTIGYQYTDGINRTRLTWPDTSYYVNYGYDALNHVLSASEQGLSYLANYGYDNVARRATLQYGVTAAEMSYSWSAQDDLLMLAHNFAGTASDNTFTDTFTPSHQLATSTISNPSYILTPGAAGTDTYGATTSGGNANKLNQYPSFTPSGGAAASLSYDKNGNMATDGAWIYVYDPENRLMTANMSGSSVAFTYDPLGRRTSKTVNGMSTFFLDDGDTEIAEYDGSGNLLRRYVPGPNIDEPIAMVTPPSSSNPEVIKYFHYDKIGSVVAMSDSSGNVESGDGPYTYDVYGNMTGSTSGVPYRFTGQRLDPETGLYYYRARYYSSSLGRFLQVDPVGYKNDLDLYTYVGNDPTDNTDVDGRDVVPDLENGGTMAQYKISVNYMSHSRTFRRDFARLQHSRHTYKIRVDPKAKEDIYQPDSRTVDYNPTQGAKFNDGSIQSPAMGMGHEINHAAEDDVDHAAFMKGLVRPSEPSPPTTTVNGVEQVTAVFGEAPEEIRATNAEGQMAREIGEPTRTSHSDGAPVTVGSPTSHCISTTGQVCSP